MQWRTGLIGFTCLALLLIRHHGVNPKQVATSLPPLPTLDLMGENIDWAKVKLEEVQEDPLIAQTVASLTAAPRLKGCATEPIGFNAGFTTDQWVNFKQMAKPGLREEKLLDLLGSPYCPVAPEAVRRAEFATAVAEGRVQVVRWVPASDLYRNNVLDVYIHDERVLTHDIYQLN